MLSLRLNPEQRKVLKGLVQESVNSLYREDAEKQLRKDIADRAADELEIDKKYFNKLCRTVFKDSLSELGEEAEVIANLYEMIGSDEGGDSWEDDD